MKTRTKAQNHDDVHTLFSIFDGPRLRGAIKRKAYRLDGQGWHLSEYFEKPCKDVEVLTHKNHGCVDTIDQAYAFVAETGEVYAERFATRFVL
jgi:hypothetical protein